MKEHVAHKRLTSVPRIAIITVSAVIAVLAATFPFVFAQIPEEASVVQIPVVTNDRPSFMAGRNGGFGQNDYGSFVEPFRDYEFEEIPDDPLGVSSVPDFNRAQFSESASSTSSVRSSSSSSQSFKDDSPESSLPIRSFSRSRDLCGDQQWYLPFMIGRDPLSLCVLDLGPDDTGVFGPFGF